MSTNAVHNDPKSAMSRRVSSLEIDGVELNGPTEGFGSLWRKRYWITLPAQTSTPTDVIADWKAHFGEFWPSGNRFYGPITSLSEGDVAVLDLEMPGGADLSSGVMVLEAGPESFSLITPEGHIFAGVITFSARSEQDRTLVQSEIVMRASDPVFEIGMLLFGHRQEDRFWAQTLRNLGRSYGLAVAVEQEQRCLDRHFQWSQIGNIRENALLRSIVAKGTSPVTRLTKKLHRQRSEDAA